MGVQQDLKDLGQKLAKLRKNPEQFRFALAIGMLAFGMVAIKIPLSARIINKKLELVEAEEIAQRAERVMELRKSSALFEQRLNFSSEASDWQEYLYAIVAATGVSMPKQEASAAVVIYDFEKIILPIQITGSYSEIWNFVDTVERGSRMVRLDTLSLSVSEGVLTLQCNLVGIARQNMGGLPMMEGASPASSAPPVPEPKAEGEDYA